jgi:hypothetical protein
MNGVAAKDGNSAPMSRSCVLYPLGALRQNDIRDEALPRAEAPEDRGAARSQAVTAHRRDSPDLILRLAAASVRREQPTRLFCVGGDLRLQRIEAWEAAFLPDIGVQRH